MTKDYLNNYLSVNKRERQSSILSVPFRLSVSVSLTISLAVSLRFALSVSDKAVSRA